MESRVTDMTSGKPSKLILKFALPLMLGGVFQHLYTVVDAAIATSSMATEMVKGKTIEEALKLTNKAVMEALDGLPPVKVHCSVLAEQAIKAALSDYYTRIGVDPLPIVGPVAECSHEDGSCSCGL